MTDNKDIEDKTTKKLTLGGSKLTLGKTVHPRNLSRTMGSSGSTVVVEVKRGKAVASEVNIRDDRENIPTDHLQVSRRLSVLQKAREEDKLDDSKISTLSKIVEMNQSMQVEKEPDNLSASEHITSLGLEPNTSRADKNDLELKANKQKLLQEEEEFERKKLEDAKALIKQKAIEPKKIKKSDIFNMLSEDSGDIPAKTRSLASIQRAKAKQRRKSDNLDGKKQDKVYREVVIPEVITVSELSNIMTEGVTDVIRELMKLGVMATANQSIDADTADLVVTSFGHSVKRVQESDVENILNTEEDKPEYLKPRAPIVTVMGHVDHGKTSLLDALKSTDVAAGEAGGITQHIGAYSVKMSDNRMITFIDTPGHEAFTEMRTRGAKVTDIVVLVVAADDGIKTQTIEAISHAKAAGVPIIVAINKIDKPEANIEKVKNELLQHELVPEDLGGDVVVVPVSAKEKKNLDKLEEAILLVAEMEDLKANPNTIASGVVIESKIDAAKGVTTSLLVQSGTLQISSLVVVGTSFGRVRKMLDDNGKTLKLATPSMPVEILGLNQAPSAGDKFFEVLEEKHAREIILYRERKEREEISMKNAARSIGDIFKESSE